MGKKTLQVMTLLAMTFFYNEVASAQNCSCTKEKDPAEKITLCKKCCTEENNPSSYLCEKMKKNKTEKGKNAMWACFNKVNEKIEKCSLECGKKCK